MRLALLVALPLVVGCGASAQDAARLTLTTTAYGAVHADKAFGDAYELASDAARDANDTQEGKDADMADWDRAADAMERVIAEVYSALATAEIALDAWEQTADAESWNGALACLAERLRELSRVLEEREVNIPAPLAKALTFTGDLACQ